MSDFIRASNAMLQQCRRPLGLLALIWLGFCASPPVYSALLIDSSTVGRYNDSIGTLLDTLGTYDPFPCADSACGDVQAPFPTAPNLSAAATQLGGWLTDPSNPGGNWSAGQVAIPGTWAVNTETAIIYSISAPTGLKNLSLNLGVDNGIFVWLDGNYLFGQRDPGPRQYWDYQLTLGDLAPGTHYLQLLREDHGGSTGYDINFFGDAAGIINTQIPVPGTLPVFAVGLMLLLLILGERGRRAYLAGESHICG